MRIAPACVLILVACSAQPPASPEPVRPTPSLPATPPALLVATLAGEWRVAGIDGKQVDQPEGLTLSGDAHEIWWAPRCAGLIRSYAIEGTSVRIGPARGFKPPAPGELPRAICAIGLPPRIGDVTRALDSAVTIRRTPTSGVEISGGGRSVLLFSQ